MNPLKALLVSALALPALAVFADYERSGNSVIIHPASGASRTVRLQVVNDRIIRVELKTAAPGKLYLGCRGAGGAPEFTVRAAAKYCDVISYNIYRRHLREFRLPAGVDKPVLVGEFHFGALDRGPFCPGLILLRDQKERAEVYEDYVRSALEHPLFVGVHWHQFSDQATSGRFDGENMQVGWTDVCDTPYWETIEGIRRIGYDLYGVRAGK